MKKRRSRLVQQAYPWVSGALVALGYYLYTALRGEPVLGDWRHDFLSHVNDVNAIIIGAIFAVAAIIAGLQDKKSIKILKDTDTYQDLISYLIKSSAVCLLLTAFNFIIMIFMLAGKDWPHDHTPHRLLISAWLGVAVAAGLSVYRLIKFFGVVLFYDADEMPTPPEPVDLSEQTIAALAEAVGAQIHASGTKQAEAHSPEALAPVKALPPPSAPESVSTTPGKPPVYASKQGQKRRK